MDDKRSIVWFSAFVIVVVVIGVAAGILIDRYLLRPPPSGYGYGRMGPDGGRMGGPPGGMMGLRGAARRGGALAERLARDLTLTAAQQTQVEAILARRRAKLDEIRTDAQGRMQKEQAELRAEIRALLDPAQQKKFDEEVASTPGLGMPPQGPPGGQGLAPEPERGGGMRPGPGPGPGQGGRRRD